MFDASAVVLLRELVACLPACAVVAARTASPVHLHVYAARRYVGYGKWFIVLSFRRCVTSRYV